MGTFFGDVLTNLCFLFGDVLTNSGTFWLGDVLTRGRFDLHPVDKFGIPRCERAHLVPCLITSISFFIAYTQAFFPAYLYLGPNKYWVRAYIHMRGNRGGGGRGQQNMISISSTMDIIPNKFPGKNIGPQGFWGSGENGYLFSGSWGALVIILGELGSKLIILGI